jgi:hypothetical protein
MLTWGTSFPTHLIIDNMEKQKNNKKECIYKRDKLVYPTTESRNFRMVAVPMVVLELGDAPAPAPVNKLFLE